MLAGGAKTRRVEVRVRVSHIFVSRTNFPVPTRSVKICMQCVNLKLEDQMVYTSSAEFVNPELVWGRILDNGRWMECRFLENVGMGLKRV